MNEEDRGMSGPLEVELQAVVTFHVWVQGIELRFSPRIICVLNPWVITPSHNAWFFFLIAVWITKQSLTKKKNYMDLSLGLR